MLVRHSENWDLLMGQGFNGLAWYHGWGVRGHQWVTALGFGAQVAVHEYYYYFSTSPNDPKSTPPPEDPGPGYLLGVGYELRPRLLLMGYCSIGTTKSRGFDASTFRQGHLNVLLQYLWD